MNEDWTQVIAALQEIGQDTTVPKSVKGKIDETIKVLSTNGNDAVKINRAMSELSELSDTGAVTLNNFKVPGLTTRRAETTVELKSGQSFVMAGLLQSNINRELDKYPGLANIPLLGMLFRSENFQRGETELVIVVTPYIVEPVASDQVTLPTSELPIRQPAKELQAGFVEITK